MASVSTFVNRGFNTTTEGFSTYRLLKGAKKVGDAPDLRAQKNEVGVQRQVVPSRKIEAPDSGNGEPDTSTPSGTIYAPSIADQLSKASNRTIGLRVASFAPVVGPLFGAAAVASAVDEQIDRANKAMKTGVFSKLAEGVEPFSKFSEQAVSVALPFGKDITDEVAGAIGKSGNITTTKGPGVRAGLTVSPDVVSRQVSELSRLSGPVMSQIDPETGKDLGKGPRAGYPTGKFDPKAMTAQAAPVSSTKGPGGFPSVDPEDDPFGGMKVGGPGVPVGSIGPSMGKRGTPWSSGVETTPIGPFVSDTPQTGKHDVTKAPNAAGDNLKGGSSGGGGGDGGFVSNQDYSTELDDPKIVCSMMNKMYGFGSFRNNIWLHYQATIQNDKAYELGYHKLFVPLVSLMPKYKGIRKVLEYWARQRTASIRKELREQPISLTQWLLRRPIELVFYVVGSLIKYGIIDPANIDSLSKRTK